MPANPTPAEGVLVPVEPTREMLAAGQEAWLDSAGADPSEEVYLAMLAARPAAPTQSAAQTGEVDLPPISLDGPHKPDGNRLWLSRQLLDSRLTAEEAYSIVAYSPSIQDALSQPEPSQ